MRQILIGIISLFSISSFAQNEMLKNLEGEFFYHRTNTSTNYFDKPTYEIDSVFILKEQSNDTIITWTTGVSRPIKKEELKALEKEDKFNIYFQKGITQKNGKTLTHRMKPNYFKIENDTLFELTYKYSISQDSFLYLKENKSMSEVIDITDSVSKKDFKPIFSLSFFNTTKSHTIKELDDSCPNTIFLDRVWETEEGKFHEFHIENKCGYWGHHWGYVIDENLEIVKYGGYYSKAYKKLNKKNLVYKKEDDQ